MNRIRNKISLCFIVVLVLSALSAGCSGKAMHINTSQKSASYVEDEDYQSFLRADSAFAKAENGYYFLNGMKLYFFDTKAKESYIVCNKTNCKHDSADCMADFNIFNYYPFQLSFCNNALYILGWEEEGNNLRHNYIYEISLENYKRKKAAYLFDGTDTGSVSFIIHRGYVYYLKGSAGSLKETTSYLYRKKLGSTNKKEKAEIIYEFSGIGASIIDIKASANHILVLNASYGDTKGNDYKTSYCKIDIHSLEAKEIAGNETYSLFADENNIYYENGTDKVYCINLNTNEEKLFCNINGPCYISADSKYIYFDNRQKMHIEENFNDRKIYVYDKKGSFVTEIVPKNPTDACYFGGDDVMIFKEITVTGEVVESEGAKGYYVLDKSQITSPDKQFIDME